MHSAQVTSLDFRCRMTCSIMLPFGKGHLDPPQIHAVKLTGDFEALTGGEAVIRVSGSVADTSISPIARKLVGCVQVCTTSPTRCNLHLVHTQTGEHDDLGHQSHREICPTRREGSRKPHPGSWGMFNCHAWLELHSRRRGETGDCSNRRGCPLCTVYCCVGPCCQ